MLQDQISHQFNIKEKEGGTYCMKMLHPTFSSTEG
jgi:hypothetical protein